ncbi:MAG: LysR family transcriptional regulator [Alcaligenaceae bacterium]|nr:LysR family transcriptional regulator [Alcaligenaceae bacterium]
MSPYHFDLHHLRAFMVVAEHLHFRKAAAILHITQPGLSRTIKALEDALEVELFDRSTRHVRLSKAGEFFLLEVEKVFVHLDRAIMFAQESSSGMMGYLKIAYNDFAVQDHLPTFIEELKREYPSIKTEMIFMTTQDQITALQKDQIDIGFGFSYTGVEEHELLNSIPLIVDEPILLLPKNHPFANRERLRLEELRDEHFVIGTSNEWRIWRKYFFELFEHAGTKPIIEAEASSVSGIMSMAAVKNCAALLSRSLSKFMHSDLVPVAVELSEHMPIAYISLMWNQENNNPSLPYFLEFAKQIQNKSNL